VGGSAAGEWHDVVYVAGGPAAVVAGALIA